MTPPGSKAEEMTIFTVFLTFLLVVLGTIRRARSFGLDQHLLVFFFTLLAVGIWKTENSTASLEHENGKA